MKNIFLHIFWIPFVLFSCNNEELLNEYEHPIPIRFSSQCIDITTKTAGVISGNTLPANTHISLFSLTHQPGISADSWLPNPFNNTPGLADTSGDILYDNTYYFPVGEELDFFAVHPVVEEMNPTYGGEEEITFSLKKNTADQFDLMYASLYNQSKKSQTLIFEFHHLLTQITFQIVKKEGVTVDLPLTQIEVTAPQTGVLNIRTGLLTPLANTNTTFVLNTETDINQTSQIPGQFLLFPQTTADIILSFGTDGNHVYPVSISQDAGEWIAGQNYQYTITINSDIISTIAPKSYTQHNEAGNSSMNDNTSTGKEKVITKSIKNQPLSIYLSKIG